MTRFRGRVAIITGAASGIGRATAVRLGSEGATVACLDVAAEGSEKTAAAIDADGGRAQAFACDVSDPASVADVVERVAGGLGRPEVVCNVAGIGRFAHTVDMPLDDWHRIIAVNLTGTFLVCRATLPHLLDGGGTIVNVASTAGVIGQPYSAAYAASKGGVALLTKALAVEYLERGVRVNAVAPGGIETPIVGSFAVPDDASRRLMARIMSPMGFGQPEEVAGVIAFLASDEARYVTGAVYAIDGGVSA